MSAPNIGIFEIITALKDNVTISRKIIRLNKLSSRQDDSFRHVEWISNQYWLLLK